MTISCTFANADETQVIFTDNRGDTYTVPVDWPGRFREAGNDGGGVVGFLAGGGTIEAYVEPETPEAPLALTQIACARLQVDGWDVTEVGRSTGTVGAFVADTDLVWVFLSEEQPDTDYIVIPSDGVTKFTDRIEIARPGLSGVSFVIQRVQ